MDLFDLYILSSTLCDDSDSYSDSLRKENVCRRGFGYVGGMYDYI